MAEFKKLSDVEVVAEPMETANVLIEENGVIKKAPKTAVGGSSIGEDVDLVISIANSQVFPITADDIIIKSGSIEDVRTALMNDKIPIVNVEYHSNDGVTIVANTYTAQTSIYSGYIIFHYITPYANSLQPKIVAHSLAWDSNNTFDSHLQEVATLTSV